MILDGKKVKNELLECYKEKITKEKIKAKLAVIQVGNNEASNIYIRNKEKACKYVGIDFELFKLESDVKEEKIIKLIDDLNNDKNVTGIILQSPISKKLDYSYLSNLIKCEKDVDGFTKNNIYNLYLGKDCLIPCTVRGIIKLLSYYNIDLTGKDVLVIGRGPIVGRPLLLALLNKNASVSICHSKSRNLKQKCLNSDIIISAVGVPHLISKDMVNKDSIVIDVGISYKDGKIVGDVDYINIKDNCKAITPNPGGVGPMTVAMIIDNILLAYERGIK